MERMAQTIVKRRKLVLVLAALLLVPSVFGMAATRINYDILTYLPQELDSMIGEISLEKDFNLASTAMITVEGLPTQQLLDLLAERCGRPQYSPRDAAGGYPSDAFW